VDYALGVDKVQGCSRHNPPSQTWPYFAANPNIRFGETWEVSADGQWTLRAVAPNVISGLYYSLILPNHQMTYDWDHGTILLASLGNETGEVGDNVGRLWEWDGTARAGRRPPSSAAMQATSRGQTSGSGGTSTSRRPASPDTRRIAPSA
jgi:hypothetical protein